MLVRNREERKKIKKVKKLRMFKVGKGLPWSLYQK